jgi:hypothetical protein
MMLISGFCLFADVKGDMMPTHVLERINHGHGTAVVLSSPD